MRSLRGLPVWSWTIPLTSLLAATSNAQAQQPWPAQTYTTENFTAPDLAINRTGQTAPGYLFLGPLGPLTTVLAPVIMTDANELIWRGPTANLNNFRTQQLAGKPVLSYWAGFGASGPAFGHGYGSVEILDDTYKHVARICGPTDFVTYDPAVYPGNATAPCYIDNHESFITDRGSIVVTAYNVTQIDLRSVGGPRRGWAFDAQFYEIDIKSQKVLFRWRHFDHLDQIPLNASNYLNRTGDVSPLTLGGTTYGNTQALPWDPFHINSVQPLADGFLVNSRFYWSSWYVSKPGGAVVWNFNGGKNGTFTNGPGVAFQWQHMTRTPDGFADIDKSLNITLHDNANEFLPPYYLVAPTRGLKINIDMKTKRTTLLRSLQDPKDVIYNPAQGSYQQLPKGHVLIGYGTIPKIKEFDASGRAIYTAQFGNATNTLPPPVTNYRAYRNAWSATPYYNPKVKAAQGPGDSITIHMSWNGATEYDAWRIYAGSKRANLKTIATIPRKGFETKYVSPSTAYRFVVVEALQGNKALRNSTVAMVAQ